MTIPRLLLVVSKSDHDSPKCAVTCDCGEARELTRPRLLARPGSAATGRTGVVVPVADCFTEVTVRRRDVQPERGRLDNADHVSIVIYNSRWRLGLAQGEAKYNV